MQCEMCGSEGQLFKANIEGIVLRVCKKCSKYGKVIAVERPAPKSKRATPKRRTILKEKEAEPEYVVSPGYASKIRKARERLGLKQKDFANKLNERESLVSKMESGSFEPSIKLARKLEKMLNIHLVEELSNESKALAKASNADVTIGDMVKLRKRN